MSGDGRQKSAGLFNRRAGVLTAAAIGVLLLWRIFTDSPSWHELVVGVVATMLTTAFFAQVLRHEKLSITLRLRDLVQLWPIPWYMLSKCWQITWILLKDLAGKPAGSIYRDCGFQTSRHDPALVGRTVLALAYTTAAPNFIVIGIDPEQSLMIFHQLERTEISSMTQKLGARA